MDPGPLGELKGVTIMHYMNPHLLTYLLPTTEKDSY